MKINQSTLKVRFSDVDAAGIVYFARYAGFIDESFIDLLRKYGVSWDDRKEEFLIPVVTSTVDFHKPAKAGDILTIYSAIIEIRNKYFQSVHAITRETSSIELLITGSLGRVTVDSHTFTSISIPDHFRKQLENNMISVQDWENFVNSCSSNKNVSLG
ncbi:MAG: acyl-CoA thioesterase [Candidatus Heimdallarchaeota archaeon]|nr:acyl-CoA thioesterase [Candidatus Heimdallarchaeota archaeon]